MSGACSSTAMAMVSVFVVVRGVVVAVMMMIMVMVVVVVVMFVVAVAVRALVRAPGGVARDLADHRGDVALQLLETRVLLARALVHVEPAIHLDLQAVPARGRVRERADELHALVR